jgi:hypothetical protein
MPKYKQQKVTIEVPENYTEVERRAIATEIIDFIVERTQSGLDKDGKMFKGYSKSYKESLDFKNAGKNPNKVDLTLTEEMLNELKLIKTTKGKIEIGFDGRRNKLNGKVEGNIKGTYGQKKSTGKARDFLGITKTQKEKILKNYPLLKEEERLARILQIASATEAGEKILSESQITDLRDRLEDFEEG